MLATIVRSPLALNVGGEEPERVGAPQDRKARGHPPDRDRRLQPDADRAALVDVGALGGDAADGIIGSSGRG
jgi:hypothetical protein